MSNTFKKITHTHHKHVIRVSRLHLVTACIKPFYICSFIAIYSLSGCAFDSRTPKQLPHYTIGTGSVGAVFYPAATAMCDVINAAPEQFTCEAVSTKGSVYNLEALDDGTHDFAISQGPVQYEAHNGIGAFSKAPARNTAIRTVLPLHNEVLTLAVKRDTGISAFSDLKNKRVNIANKGSGSRVIIEAVLEAKGLTHDFFAQTSELASSELPYAFCAGRIDAALYTVGHPNRLFVDMINECDVDLVSLDDDAFRVLTHTGLHAVQATIPAGTYAGVSGERVGIGIPVVLSATTDVPRRHIDHFVRAILKNEKKLADSHPIFKNISFKTAHSGCVAPFHAGAKRISKHIKGRCLLPRKTIAARLGAAIKQAVMKR